MSTNSNPVLGANNGGRGIKVPFVRISDDEAGPTSDYADVLVGDGAPSGAYGRASGTTLLYIRKDATHGQNCLYVSEDGGTTWTAFAGQLEATGTIPAGNGAGNAGDLNTDPVELVAAPGAGLYIEVDSIHWFLDYGTAAYDGTKTGSLRASYTDETGDEVVGAVAETGFMDQTADTYALVKGIDCVPVGNAAVVALSNNAWYAAAGDSPVKYRVSYSIRAMDPTA